MRAVLQDLRYAARQLRKMPGFAITVILTLALGIGASTAVFTLFDQALLRMLPVSHPKELVRFHWTGSFSGSSSMFGGDQHDFFSYPMYKDLRQHSQAFAGLLAADKANVGLSWHQQAESKDAEIVSGNYFDLLGLKPTVGRLLNENDETAKNANPVVVLSYDYWRSHFGAQTDVIGQSVLVNGHPFTIVGVAPSHFYSVIGDYRPGLFVPLTMVSQVIPWRDQLDDMKNHQSLWLTLVARLKPGVTGAQAESSLGPLWRSLRANELTLYKSHSARFDHNFVEASQLKVLANARGFAPTRMELRKPLIILLSMATLLMVLCAINVATLLLLRAAARAREVSMRYALGARRGRIIAQLLVEGGLLGVAGTVLGLLVAPSASLILVRLMVAADPGSEPYSAAIDTRVFLFAMGISLVVTLAFSTAPLFYFLKPDLANSLRQNSGTASRSTQRFRKIAVGVEVGLSVLLLASAGLFVRTLWNLRGNDVGFQTARLATFSLDPTASGYGDDRTPQVVFNSLEALRRIPGVASVAATDDPVLTGGRNTSGFSVQGYKAGEDENMSFESGSVTPGYFATMQQPLLAGREFTLADATGKPQVAIVSANFAKRFFGSPQNALGRMISDNVGPNPIFDTTIVGVAADCRHADLRAEFESAVYSPYLQMKHPNGVAVYVRTEGEPRGVMQAMRGAVHGVDPTLVVDGLRTMDEQINRVASDERALALLSLGFAVLAMLLAGVGLYGVLAYSTEQRTREFGVRLALGSTRSRVVMLVARDMAWIVGVATALALPTAVALARLFSSELYGVKAFDLLTLSSAVLFTVLMVLVALALPARRAAAIEPMQALRSE
jgi:putative ABC transport system permease protein